MVGLVRTAATFGSSNSSRILARRRAHCSRSPSCWASSNTARAYRLAAAVATRDLLDRPLDQLPVLGIVERFADDLLGGGDDELRDLGPHRADGLVSLGFDLLARALDRALGLLVRLLPQLLPELLGRLRSAIDHALRGPPRIVELGLCLRELGFGRSSRLLGLLQLTGDGLLAGFVELVDPWIDEHRADSALASTSDRVVDTSTF